MKQTSILGLSGIDRSFAVSLLTDSSVVFAIEEDKLRRFRGLGLRHLTTGGARAIDLALSRVEGGLRGIETVAYVPPFCAAVADVAEQTAFIAEFLHRRYGFSPPVAAVDHVSAHLAFERAVHGPSAHVFHVGRSRAVFSHFDSGAYELSRAFPVVRFVEICAEFLGLDAGRIHHLENIATFGNARFVERLRELLEKNLDRECINKVLGKTAEASHAQAGGPLQHAHYDLAASLHRLLCDEICDLLRSIPGERRAGAVALSGGVFQSWSLNDAVARAFPETRFLVSFAPGNPCCAIGGPLALAKPRLTEQLSPFLGPKYSQNEVKAVLDNCKARYDYCSFPQAVRVFCDSLARGAMVGWFSGPCEFGYRALGARSVFANPENPYACDNLSSFLKKRPSYFTYAVAMKDSDAAGVESPYLSRSTTLPEYFADAAVRIQTVSERANPVLYHLLGAFQEKTRVRALLNTSLNYFDEPIACTPRDALKTFYASGLDVLIMEGFVLRKS